MSIGVAPREGAFKLSAAQRLRWAIGTAPRALGFAITAMFVSWLAWTSVGPVAVAYVLGGAAFGHWVPYALAGRHTLGVNSHGVTDHLRFRTRRYAWADIDRVQPTSLGGGIHGLVLTVRTKPAHKAYTPKLGAVRTVFIRSSWRPHRAEVDNLFASIRDDGWIDDAGSPTQSTVG